MKCIKKSEVIYLLKLDEAEAMKLKELVQNPIGENEGEENRKFRENVWEALNL